MTKKKRPPRHDIDVVFRAPLGSIGAQLFQKAITHALRSADISDAVISCAIVSDAEIRTINRQYLKHDFATDIITFPLEDDPLEAELVISAETARKQAREYDVSVREECVRLAIHGILHLSGYDDRTQKQRERMKSREDELLQAFMKKHRKKA
ncbi:MAG: rRNA maturation RNase YbeY [Ignavibacteria bacterium]|nr:MAG: rRNA maturation RNase YbeY [Ignavibacteria bacterium]